MSKQYVGSDIASLPPDTHAGRPPRDGTSNLRFWFIAAAGAAAAIALGWFANRLGWLLVITLVGFIVWQAASIRRLWRWQQRGLGRPPDLPAPWDEIADLAYRRTRDGRARIRALLRRMRRDARFAEALPDALVVIDSNGRIEWQSRRASEYLGLTRRDIGKSITSLLRHPDLVAVLEGRAAESLAEITLPLSERILEIRVTHLDESRRLVTARDTTQLQRLLTMRQEFVANVSHELRTPLTVIMGYLEQIDDETFDAAEAKKIIRRPGATAAVGSARSQPLPAFQYSAQAWAELPFRVTGRVGKQRPNAIGCRANGILGGEGFHAGNSGIERRRCQHTGQAHTWQELEGLWLLFSELFSRGWPP